MVIKQLQPRDVITNTRLRLGLPTESTAIDDVMLAALIRHSAAIHCPCSRASLRSALDESLHALAPDEPRLLERIDDAIEAAFIAGNLLELKDVATGQTEAKATWLFAAPPAFVVRPGGTVFLIGLVQDQDLFLPQSLASRLCYDGPARYIVPTAGEDLATELRELGLLQWSEEVWLKAPKHLTPQALLADVSNRLQAQPPAGTIDDIQLLDPTKPVHYYAGRWIPPASCSGMFVARRPQEYGAPIWGFAELQNGHTVKFLDLPIGPTRWRGCDFAWHLQMAIDHCRGQPQTYRRTELDGGVQLDFYSPLPIWAQRRLMLLGRRLMDQKSLISYWLPVTEVETEANFLHERLYLTVRSDTRPGA